MISAKFLWGNILLGRELHTDAKSSKFEIFESALYIKSVSIAFKGPCQQLTVGALQWHKISILANPK